MFKINQNISCIILAAGYSSRMRQFQHGHKSLLEIEKNTSMLKKIVLTFKEAGIEKIYIVLGHKNEQVQEYHSDLDCIYVYNQDFDKGMFSSVCAGILALDKDIEATFLIPVDASLVSAKTLSLLLEKRRENREAQNDISLIIPTFLDMCGHPPLIEKKHFVKIRAHAKNENNSNFHGLKGYFASLFHKDEEMLKNNFLNSHIPFSMLTSTSQVDFFPICDAGIVSDIDTQEEYEKALTFLSLTKNRKAPDINEAFHLLLQAELPIRVKKHSIKVGLASLRLAFALKNALKVDFSLNNAICAGLLHDICRTQKSHAKQGANYLSSLGWDELALIVASHTNLPKALLEEFNLTFDDDLDSFDIEQNVDNVDYLYPALCVYLADKFYSSDKYVTLEQRHDLMKEKYAHDETALLMISKRQKIADAVSAYFKTTTLIEPCMCAEKLINLEEELTLLLLVERYKYCLEE